MMRRAMLVIAVLLGLAAPVEAQNSGYGILGIGFPTRPTSIRARALGDGPGATDPQSALNPGALGLATNLTIAIGASQEYRNLTLAGVETGGLHQVRFPYAVLSSRLGRTRLSYSVGFFQYAERTFDLNSTDTVTLRGAPVIITDRNGSAGAIIDGRGALAWSFSPNLSLGTAVHVLGGSARLTARRAFSDSTYRPYVETSDAVFSGFGWSVGVLATPSARFRAGLAARVDGKLSRSVNRVPGTDVSLPVSVTGGFNARLVRVAILSAGASWRSWSKAGAGVGAGTYAFDTWEAGAGLELGGVTRSTSFPIRLGARYATLPFSPTTEQPHELHLAAGTRIRFAERHAQFDFTVERIMREGGNATERVWHFILGLELVP
jgi:hypothetical protein